jgi:hypothetical protein
MQRDTIFSPCRVEGDGIDKTDLDPRHCYRVAGFKVLHGAEPGAQVIAGRRGLAAAEGAEDSDGCKKCEEWGFHGGMSKRVTGLQ